MKVDTELDGYNGNSSKRGEASIFWLTELGWKFSMASMRRGSIALPVLTALGLTIFGGRGDLWDFDGERYEEPAGASFSVLCGPQHEIYGVAFGFGTWLVGTPVFGDYNLSLFSNGIEDAFYSGLGLTVRIMPHWRAAPFAGAGGGYNLVWSGSERDAGINTDENRGCSYWAAHAEGGIRFWLSSRVRLLELMVRYVWPDAGRDREYWLLGIGTGTGW